MRRVSFWLGVAGVSILSANVVWPAVVNRSKSPGLRALNSWKNGS